MSIILWLIFILSSIVLMAVVLLQEPKGGGLAEAFGGMGAQTFGVKATGITRFTSYVGAVFLLSAVLLTCHELSSSAIDLPSGPPPAQEQPGQPGTEGAPAPAAPADQGAPAPESGASGQ